MGQSGDRRDCGPRDRLRLAPLALTVLCLQQALPTFAFGLGDLFGASPGAGGMIVYDPSNHAESAVSAAQAVRQTALQVRAEIQRLQQLAIELQQLRSLPETTLRTVLADWYHQLDTLDAIGGQLGTLSDQLARIQTRSRDWLSASAALGVAPTRLLAREAALSATRGDVLATLLDGERQSLASLQTTAQTLARLQAQIPASSGVQQSLQTTNAYLDLLAGQTSQLLQVSAAQAAALTAQRRVEAQDAGLAEVREAQRLTGDLRAIADLRSGLREREARQGLGLLRPLPDGERP